MADQPQMLPDDATFTVADREWPFVRPDKMTFREQRSLKHLSGMTLGTMQDALADMDADAWIALLLVAMQRAEPKTPIETHESMVLDLEGGVITVAESLIPSEADDKSEDGERPTEPPASDD